MGILIVVENPDTWPFDIKTVKVVAARQYLIDTELSAQRDTVVFNLCRSYAYQSLGYYVSLLAEARGHRPQPSVSTLQDLRDRATVRVVSSELAELVQTTLARLTGKSFELSIYFGRNVSERYKRLARALFNQFRAPLLRARFVKSDDKWQLQNVSPVATKEIPPSHHDFVVQAAEEYFADRRWSTRTRKRPKAHLAILVDPDEQDPPSDETALKKFERAAQGLDMATERIDRNDAGRLSGFDALFIRATTSVNHYTFRFANRAEADGMVVIDDPVSIIRCTNKVFLKELLERNNVPIPRTLIVDASNRDKVGETLGWPCVLKVPDSSFSRGVEKAENEEALQKTLDSMLEGSALVVAQEFLPTSYDWRVGVLDRRPIYACRYFMAPRHWQILKHEGDAPSKWGRVETIMVEAAPTNVIRTAVKAANLIGDGLYGVDIKQSGKRAYVIEVNDNPTIESGVEDRYLGNGLYEAVMRVFLDRIEARRHGRS